MQIKQTAFVVSVDFLIEMLSSGINNETTRNTKTIIAVCFLKLKTIKMKLKHYFAKELPNDGDEITIYFKDGSICDCIWDGWNLSEGEYPEYWEFQQ